MFTRIQSFLQDKQTGQKNWAFVLISGHSVTEYTILPADETVLPKWRDSSWRQNRRWIVLRNPNESCNDLGRPIFCKDPDSLFGMVLAKPLPTQLFAMRLDPEPLCVFLPCANGRTVSPEFVTDEVYAPGQEFLIFKTEAEVLAYGRNALRRITCI